MSKDHRRKQDVLDPELSKQLAWRMVPLADAPPPPKPAPPPPPNLSAEEAKHRVERCEKFAKDILAAWEMKSIDKQRRETKRLLRFASRLGFDIVLMSDHPLAAIRFLRLTARHAEQLKLGDEACFELSWIPVPIAHPEMVDFVVEAALSRNGSLLFALDMALERGSLEGKHPSLGKRLVELFETSRDEQVRSAALRLLSIDDFPDAIPTLQKALRLPHARMRYHALAILVQMKGHPLRTEDMQWLLDDAVAHPLSRGTSTRGYDRVRDYEGALIDALQKCPPPEGWKPLQTIIDGHGEHVNRDRPGLGAEWALEALAVGYPERAVPFIDHQLVVPGRIGRWRLVDAIGRLPAELAGPRLLQATADSDEMIIDAAVKMWFKRFGNECPVDPLGGVPKELLVAPPSERMLANITALRSNSKETRNAMLDVLLKDLPETQTPPKSLERDQRESLALLMFTFRLGRSAFDHATFGRMSLEELAQFFLKRGGSIVFDVLARWADEGIRAGVHRGWLEALAHAGKNGLLDAQQIERIRAMARVGVEHPHWESLSAAIAVFRCLGTPVDLGLRLLDELVQKEGTIDWPWFPSDTVGALSNVDPTADLDDAITRELEKAWLSRRWRLCRYLMQLATERSIPSALDFLMRQVISYDGAYELAEAVGNAFDVLHDAKRIEDEMVMAILADPDKPLFPMAADRVSKKSPPAWIEALWRVLDDPARRPAATGTAVYALLRIQALPVDDERIDPILAASPLHVQAQICDMLLFDDAPLERMVDYVKVALLSDDESIVLQMIDTLYTREPLGTDELFKEVLPKVSLKKARVLIHRFLRSDGDAAGYWEDQGDDLDEDELAGWDEDNDDDDGDEPLGDA